MLRWLSSRAAANTSRTLLGFSIRMRIFSIGASIASKPRTSSERSIG